MSIGLMAKYSFFLFLFPIAISSLLQREYRQIFFDKRVFLLLPPILIICLPHYYWLLDNFSQISSQALDRLNLEAADLNILDSLTKIISSSIGFISPLILIGGYLIFKKRKEKTYINLYTKLINSFFVTVFIIISFLLLFLDIENVKVRWLHPILMIFPFWFFLFIQSKEFSIIFFKKIFYTSLFFITLLVIFTRVLQMTIGPELGYVSRLNLPIVETLKKIPSNYIHGSLIKTDNLDLFAHMISNFQNNNIFFSGRQFVRSEYSDVNCLIIDTKPLEEVSPIKKSGSVESTINKFEIYKIFYQLKAIKECN